MICVIRAHFDDIEIMAMKGVGDAYENQDIDFIGITVTDSAGSARIGKYANVTNEEMVGIRNKEQNQAA